VKARLPVLVVSILVVSVLAACGKGESPPASSGDPTTTTEAESTTTTAAEEEAASVVGVVGTEYAFALDGGTTLQAGVIDLTLTNDGEEEHQVTVARLKEGKTFDDLAAVGEDPSTLGDTVDLFGGPNGVGAGQSVTATISLEPGEYLFACFIPAPDGVAHAAKGMLTPVTVEGDEGAGEAVLESDKRLVLSDYEFGLGDDALLEAGDYEIRNEGPQVHEAVLYAPADGSTVDDVLAGVAAMNVGGANLTTLTAGEYVLMCFVPDVDDGAPHFVHGMIQAVTIE
jgi:hypothetical protein